MDVPRPTAAPPGRLVRLGVVLDTRNPIERLLEVARMCDRAGIGALWVEDPAERPGAAGAGAQAAGAGPGPAGSPGGADLGAGGAARLDAWTALAVLAGEVRRARIGAVLDAAAWPPARLARMAATLGALTGGRLELTLRAAGPQAAAAVRALREARAATTVPAALAPAVGGEPAVALAAGGPAYGAVALPAEVPTIGVQLQPPPTTEVVAIVDDLALPPAPLPATLAAAAAARQAVARAGRDPRT